MKQLLTGRKASDILNELLECDKKKTSNYNESCERKWSLKIEQNIYKYI